MKFSGGLGLLGLWFEVAKDRKKRPLFEEAVKS
ncbi:hypothetical protein C5S53_01830 [Methanophagales archaeon]|nr:hypothetical protein C5S53_01830 [Methanophagales archaeon]